MGGSGGGGFFNSNPDTVAKYLQESEQNTRDAKFNVEVAEVIRVLMAQYNGRDRDAINGHINEIESAIDKDIEGFINLLFGGSAAKHTHIDGISDIDALVMIDNCELSDGTPEQARSFFAERLRDRFPKTEIIEGNLAVTVKFSDGDIQIIPAISCKSHLKISDDSGRNWSKIEPKQFTSVLTEVNEKLSGKVVPAIKLAKSIASLHLKTQQLSGYHTEALAVDIFRDYTGPTDSKGCVPKPLNPTSGRLAPFSLDIEIQNRFPRV